MFSFLGFQAGTPDFSGKLAKPVLVRVVAKQLFYGTGTPLAEIPGLHSQNMRDKPCRIVSAAGNFACDLFRQNFRGFRLTTPIRLHVAVGGQVFELLVTGAKFFDTRADKGGGGAIDLAMHLLRLDFVAAVKRLSSSRVSSV